MLNKTSRLVLELLSATLCWGCGIYLLYAADGVNAEFGVGLLLLNRKLADLWKL